MNKLFLTSLLVLTSLSVFANDKVKSGIAKDLYNALKTAGAEFDCAGPICGITVKKIYCEYHKNNITDETYSCNLNPEKPLVTGDAAKSLYIAMINAKLNTDGASGTTVVEAKSISVVETVSGKGGTSFSYKATVE